MKKKRKISSMIGAAVLALSMSALTGCDMTLQEFFTGEKIEEEPVVNQAMTNREWLDMVNDAYGTDSDEGDLIQDAKDWGIIDEDEEIDLDAPVDEHFAATTLAKAAGYVDMDATDEEIEQAIEEHDIVCNEEVLSDPEKVQEVIEKVQEDMVHPQFEDHREIELADNVYDLTDRLRNEDIIVSGDTVTMPYSCAETLDKDMVFILPGEKYGDEAAYKVIAIIDNGDDTADIKCTPATLCEVYKRVDISGHFPVDLNEFEVADDDMVEICRKNDSVSAYSGYNKEKLMAQESDSIDFCTQISEDRSIRVSIKDIVVNAKIDWSADESGVPDVKRVFLSADYISDVSIEEKEDHDKQPSLSMFPLLPSEIGSVPVHICDGLTLYLDFSLSTNIEGKPVIKVKTGETNGFEMKGAKLRTINSVLDLADLKAEGESWEFTTLDIAVGMDYLADNEDLLIYEVTSGPVVRGDVTEHEIKNDKKDSKKSDKKDSKEDKKDDDKADEKTEKIVCVDVSGFLKVDMNVRLCDEILGSSKLDPVTKLLELDEKKSKVKWKNIHYENDKKVSVCTFEEKKDKEDTDTARGIFAIETTYLSVYEGETFTVGISSIPSGYTEKDIVWTSLDPSIVSVDANGNFKAESSGATGINVATKDGKYKSNCAVIVKASR